MWDRAPCCPLVRAPSALDLGGTRHPRCQGPAWVVGLPGDVTRKADVWTKRAHYSSRLVPGLGAPTHHRHPCKEAWSRKHRWAQQALILTQAAQIRTGRAIHGSSAPSAHAGWFCRVEKGSGWELPPDPAVLHRQTLGEPLHSQASVSLSGGGCKPRGLAVAGPCGLDLGRGAGEGTGLPLPASLQGGPHQPPAPRPSPCRLQGDLTVRLDHLPGNVFQMVRPPREHRRCFCARARWQAALSPGGQGGWQGQAGHPPASSVQPHAGHQGCPTSVHGTWSGPSPSVAQGALGMLGLAHPSPTPSL